MFNLDGLVNLELLNKLGKSSDSIKNYSFVLNYIIGNLFYNSVLYTRQSVLGSSFDFTTSPEIYELTGIYSIHFDEIDDNNFTVFNNMFNDFKELSFPLFDRNRIGNVVLSGSLKMLALYNNAFSFLTRYLDMKAPKLYLINFWEEFGGNDNSYNEYFLDLQNFINFDEFTLNDIMSPYILCEDKFEFVSHLPSLLPIVKTERLLNLIEELKQSRFSFDTLYIHNLKSFITLSISEFDLRYMYEKINNIYILYDDSCVYLGDKANKLLREKMGNLPIKVICLYSLPVSEYFRDIIV